MAKVLQVRVSDSTSAYIDAYIKKIKSERGKDINTTDILKASLYRVHGDECIDVDEVKNCLK